MSECNNEEHQKLNLKDGVNISEAKVLTLILCTFLDFGLVIWGVLTKGDFSDNLLFLTQTLIAAIAGVHVAEKLASFKKGNK